MSRRGTTRSDPDALELFLDTLTNTFGGVLFIALLVCVKLQLSKPLPIEDQQEVEQFASMRAALEREVEDLFEEHRQITRQIKSIKARTDSTHAARYKTLVEKRQALQQQGMALHATERALDAELGTLQRQRTASAKKNSRLEKELRDATRELESAGKAPLRVRRPRAHETPLQPEQALLSSGCLSFVFKYDGRGNRVKSNERDIVLDDGEVAPKPGRGLVIDESEKSRLAFEKQMAQFDPSSRYLEVFVWNDSFRSFDLVREWLSEKGFEHHVILLKKGELVPLGPRGTRIVQ